MTHWSEADALQYHPQTAARLWVRAPLQWITHWVMQKQMQMSSPPECVPVCLTQPSVRKHKASANWTNLLENYISLAENKYKIFRGMDRVCMRLVLVSVLQQYYSHFACSAWGFIEKAALVKHHMCPFQSRVLCMYASEASADSVPFLFL